MIKYFIKQIICVSVWHARPRLAEYLNIWIICAESPLLIASVHLTFDTRHFFSMGYLRKLLSEFRKLRLRKRMNKSLNIGLQDFSGLNLVKAGRTINMSAKSRGYNSWHVIQVCTDIVSDCCQIKRHT